MKKIYFDLTDSLCGGHSTGLKKLEFELSSFLRKNFDEKSYSEFYAKEGKIYKVVENGMPEIMLYGDGINQFDSSDIIVSVGQSWATPEKNPRIKIFYELKKKLNIKMALCCASMIPEMIPQWTSPVVAMSERKLFIELLVNDVDCVLCYSKDTANQFMDYHVNIKDKLRQKIKIFRMGDEVIKSKKLVNKIQNFGGVDFILYVSTLERRKNHEIIYKAYRKIIERNKDIKLPNVIFAGKKRWGVDQLLYEIENDPLVSKYFKIIDYVNDDLLVELYKNAKFCVYPSLYEGWGLPIGEALSLNKVVVASNSTSMCEIGGDCAIYLDPYDVLGWADCIEKLVINKNFLNHSFEIASKYVSHSWEETGREFISILRGLK